MKREWRFLRIPTLCPLLYLPPIPLACANWHALLIAPQSYLGKTAGGHCVEVPYRQMWMRLVSVPSVYAKVSDWMPIVKQIPLVGMLSDLHITVLDTVVLKIVLSN
jgi:hypothetical protein